MILLHFHDFVRTNAQIQLQTEASPSTTARNNKNVVSKKNFERVTEYKPLYEHVTESGVTKHSRKPTIPM